MKTLILLAVFVASSSVAQVRRNRIERAQDKKALRQDAQERRDDWRDVARLEAVRAKFEAARKSDLGALPAIEADVFRLLAAESAESVGEVHRDAKEVRQDRAELRSERDESRIDKRDDRRDLADDKRDRAVESASLIRIRAMRAEWATLMGLLNVGSLDKKSALLDEAVRLARAEVRQDRRETREDKRELREDRRETRQDRR